LSHKKYFSLQMKYIAVSLYRKMIEHPLTEGMWLKDFDNLPVPYT